MKAHLAYDRKDDALYIFLDHPGEFHHELLVNLGHKARFGQVVIDTNEYGVPLQFVITEARSKYGDLLRMVDEINPDV